MEYMEKYAEIVHGRGHGRVRWKSTWWRVETHKALHAVHVGVQATTSMLRVASQWATTAEPGIFSQIVICLFASGYLRYIVLQYVGPDTWRIDERDQTTKFTVFAREILNVN